MTPSPIRFFISLRSVVGVLFAAAALTVAACGGSTVPAEVVVPGGSGSGPTQVPLPPLNVTVLGFVGGDVGDGAASPATAGRGRQSSLAQTVGGQVVSGANGVDLKDLGWGNLFTQGLSTSPFPKGTATAIRFFAEGGSTPLATISSVGSTGLFESVVNATSLQTGSRMELELSVNGNATRIKLPILTLRNDDKLGFNVIRRQGGSMVVELFLDAVVNATSEPGSDGLSDNGLRLVVDNGSDVTGDGVVDTAARLDSADGLSFLDLNLDGRFGDPESDSITFIDVNGTGFADTPLALASEAARLALNNPESASFFLDADLDGIRSPLTERKVSEGTEADLLGSLEVSLTPTSLPSNGISAATLRTVARASSRGFPLNAPIRFELTRTGGELLASTGDAKFQSSGSFTAARILSPADAEVRLLSDGSFLLSESVLMPLLVPTSITEETPASLSVSVGTGERLAGSPDISVSKTIDLLPSDAPILTSVLVAGQQDVSNVTGGLEAVSRAAVLTWGARVRVNGQNFATTVAGNNVAVGGTPVANLTVNETGTQLEFDVPEGAVTGPISVIVGGLGGITSQNLVIAGEQLLVVQAAPSSNSIPANASFTLTFSRPLAASSLTDSAIQVRASGGSTSLGWTRTLSGDRTVVLSQGEGSPMQAGLSYEVLVTSDLRVDDSSPAVRFDPILNTPLGESNESSVVLTVTATPADVTPPSLVASVPSNGALLVDPTLPIVLSFSEAVDAASVAAAVAAGSLSATRTSGGSAIPFNAVLNSSGTEISLLPVDGGFPGSADLTVILSSTAPTVADLSGNPAATASISYTTSIAVVGITPRSGPTGAKVRVEGSGFEAAAQPLVVRMGEQVIPSFDIVDDTAIEFAVPAGATGGAVTITADGTSRSTPQPYTVTLNLQRVNLPGLAGSRPIGVSISADDSRVFLSNQGVGSISVYDLNTLALVDSDANASNGPTRLQLGSVPSEAILTRDGRKLLSLDYGLPDHPGDSFFVVDASKSVGEPENESYAIEATVQVGSRPTRIATSPDGRRWYVTNFLSSSLSIISAEAPYQVVATIPTGLGPNGVGISPDGLRCYICNYLEGSVTVFDTSGNEVVGTVPVGIGPSRARVSPDGKWVLVSCNEDSSLHVIDARENRNVLKITGPAGPSAMAFSRNGDQVFLCSRVLDVVAVYDFNEVDGRPVLSQPTFIQTGRVPSGLAVTGDGSRLVIAHESEGNASVVWLQPPVQSVIDIQFPNGEQTRSADEGQDVVILGAGFSPTLGENRVRFGTVEVLPNPAGSSKGALRVTVPVGAQSGPLTVVIGDEVSNAIDFLVTPAVLRVARILPANGAVGISPSTEIVCRCNEPVRGGTGDWVVERMLDTFTNGERDVDPTPISGTVRSRDFGYEMVFTPDAPLVELPNSNNLYRITIRQTLDDRAGNTLQRDVVSFFQLADTRGPTLLRAVLIDVDNNGIDPLDILSLVFDEDVTSRGTFPTPATGLLAFNDDSTVGTSATIQFPSLALLERTSPVSQLDPFSRTMMIRLGDAAAIKVPGLRSAVNGVTNFSGDLALRDAAGNTGILLVTPEIDVEFFVSDVPAPRALAAVLMDMNTNGIGDEGEEIGIYCNTPLTKLGPMDADDLVLSGAGTTLGTGVVFDQYPHNHRVLRITLGVGAMVDFNDAAMRISSPAALTQLVNFIDVPLAAWDGALISYSIGTPGNGPLIDANLASPVVFDDVDGNGVDAGDIIRVVFDRPMVVGNAPANRCFVLPVTGNSFGANAYVRNSQDISLDAATRARTVEIVLGANANILPQGTGNAAATVFGSSSTLVVNPSIPVWAVADEFGLSARPDPNGLVFDIGSSDTSAPVLHEAIFIDNDQSGDAGAGDAILLVFNETIRRNAVAVAAFRPDDGVTTGLTFGSGATIARGQSRSVAGQVVADNVLIVTLGTSPVVPLTIGMRVAVNTGNPVADVSGNTLVAESSAPLRFVLPPNPVLVSATVLDPGLDGVGENDVILAKFDQPMSFPGGATDPSIVFALTTVGDTFGTGATMGFATVTQAMIDLGLSNVGVGQVDRSLVRITLGASARVGRIGGVALSASIAAPIGTPAAVTVRPLTSLSFTTSQLVNALDDSTRVGATQSFNQVRFAHAPSGGATVINMTLAGGATAFTGTASHYSTLIGALNGAFVDNGLRLRAYVLPGLSGLMIADHGEGLLGIDGGIEANGDVANAVLGVFTSGLGNQLANAVGIAPTGRVDLVAPADPNPPVILSAIFDGNAPGSILVTFNKAVEFPVSLAASQVFQLAVLGDRLGTGASVSQTSATTLLIQLGSDRLLTANGVFNPNLTTSGSPSGIRVRPNLSALILADATGNIPSSVPVDIGGGTVVPSEGLSVTGFGGLPATRAIGGGMLRALAFDAIAATASGPFTIDTLTFGMTANGATPAQVAVRGVLYEDINGDRQIDVGDALLATVASGATMTFAAPLGTRTVVPSTPVRMIFAVELVPSPSLSGVSFSVSLTGVAAKDAAQQPLPTVPGVPLSGGTCTLNDSQRLGTSNGAMALTDGDIHLDTVNGARTNHAAASVTRRLMTVMNISDAELATALHANGDSQLNDVGIDLDGDSGADVLVTTPTLGVQFVGGIDSSMELDAFLEACNQAIGSAKGNNYFTGLRATRGPNNSLDFVREIRGFDTWNWGEYNFGGSNGGLLLGGDVVQRTFNRINQDTTSLWPGPLAVVFGGSNGAGQLRRDTVFLRDQDDHNPVMPSLIDDSPAALTAREGAVAVAAYEDVYLFGGRNATSVMFDLWRLVPVVDAADLQLDIQFQGPQNQPWPTRFRWEAVTASGTAPSLHGAVGVYVHESKAVRRSLVFVGGSVVKENDFVSDTIYAYSLETNAWTVLATTATSATIQKRWGASGALLANNRLVIFGGRDEAGTTQTSVQVFDFDSASSQVHVVNPTIANPSMAWAGGFQSTAVAGSYGAHLIVMGGRTDSGAIAQGTGANLLFETATSARWMPLTDAGLSTLSVPARSGAKLVEIETLHLTYGEGVSGATNTLIPVSVELPGGNELWDAEDSDAWPVIAYQHPKDNGTAASDAGDRIVVVFGMPTNLLELEPSGVVALEDLASSVSLISEITPAEHGFTIPFPLGTTAVIESRLHRADTVVITLGGPVSQLEGGRVWLSFAGNALVEEPIRAFGATSGYAFDGDIPVVGVSDATRMFTWSGANGSDWFAPENWVVAGAPASRAPNADDFVLIPESTPACIVPTELLGGSLTTIELGELPRADAAAGQLFIHGGRLHVNRGLTLGDGLSLSPLLVQLSGTLTFDTSTGQTLTFEQTVSGDTVLIGLGYSKYGNLRVAGGDLKAAGFLAIEGNISAGANSVLPLYDEGIAMVFSGAQNSSVAASDFNIGYVLVAKSSSTGVLSLANVTTSITILEPELANGRIVLGDTDMVVTEGILAASGTEIESTGAAKTIVRGIDARLRLSQTPIDNLRFEGPSGQWLVNSSFDSGTQGWSFSNWQTSGNGRTGASDQCLVTSDTNAYLTQEMLGILQDSDGGGEFTIQAWVWVPRPTAQAANAEISMYAYGTQHPESNGSSVSQYFSFGEGDYEVWRRISLNVPAYIVRKFYFSINIDVFGGAGTRIDDVKILTQYELSGGMAPGNLLQVYDSDLRIYGKANEVYALPPTVEMQHGAISAMGRGRIQFTESASLSSTSAIAMFGTDYANPMELVVASTQGIPTSLSVQGSLELVNTEVSRGGQPIAGRVTVEGGGRTVLLDAHFIDVSLVVAASGPLAYPGLFGARTDFSGTPAPGLVGTGRPATYLSFLEPAPTASQVLSVRLRNTAFAVVPALATTFVSAESAAVGANVWEMFEVQTGVTSEGLTLIGANRDHDPNNTIAWNVLPTLSYALPVSFERFASAGTNDYVLARLWIRASSATTLDGLEMWLRSNIDDTASGMISNLRFTDPSGVNRLFIGNAPSDDPLLALTQSLPLSAGDHVIELRCNLGSALPEGAHFWVEVSELFGPQGPHIIEYDPTIIPTGVYPPIHLVGVGDGVTASRAGTVTIGTSASPVVFRGAVYGSIPYINAGNDVRLVGRNLRPTDALAFTTLNTGHLVDTSAAYLTTSRSNILGLVVAGNPPQPQPFDGRLSFTLTTPSQPPKGFVFAYAVGYQGIGG